MRRTPATFARATDTGPMRGANEDWAAAMQVRPSPSSGAPLLVGAVADGIGGYAGGQVASRLAVSTFVQTVTSAYSGSVRAMFDPAAATEHGFRRANSQVLERARADSRNHGMGTTLTTALVHDGKVYVGHVGDSRLFVVRSGRARLLTRDHTVVQEKLAARVISADEAARSNERNRLTRALGVKESVVCDIAREDIADGDVLVLTTDGVHSSVSEDDIAATVRAAADANSVCRRLVALARARDGSDNMTAVCLSLGGVRAAMTPRVRARRLRRAGTLALSAITVAILVLLAVMGWGRRPPAVTGTPGKKATTTRVSDTIPIDLTLRIDDGAVRAPGWNPAPGVKLWVAGKEPGPVGIPLEDRFRDAPVQTVEFDLPVKVAGDLGWRLRRPKGGPPDNDGERGVSIDGGPFDQGSGRSVTGSTGIGMPRKRVRFYLKGGPGVGILVEITMPGVSPLVVRGSGRTEAAGPRGSATTQSGRHESRSARSRPPVGRRDSRAERDPAAVRQETTEQVTPKTGSCTESAPSQEAPAQQPVPTKGNGDAASGAATGDTGEEGQSDSDAEPSAPKKQRPLYWG